GLQRQTQRVLVRGLLRVLPADHAVREDDCPHVGQVSAPYLVLFAHPSQWPEVSVRAEDRRASPRVPGRPVQVAGAVEARQGLEGNVLNRVADVLALRVED